MRGHVCLFLWWAGDAGKHPLRLPFSGLPTWASVPVLLTLLAMAQWGGGSFPLHSPEADLPVTQPAFQLKRKQAKPELELLPKPPRASRSPAGMGQGGEGASQGFLSALHLSTVLGGLHRGGPRSLHTLESAAQAQMKVTGGETTWGEGRAPWGEGIRH